MSNKELTERQRALLTSARDAIRNDPERYNQLTYGPAPETSSCGTPRCLAGHMVVNDPELTKELNQELQETRLTERRRREGVGGAIHKVARNALGLEGSRHPVLFRGEWPVAWLKDDTTARGARKKQNETFLPTAEDAVQVIDGILDGRIQDALHPG